jgi:predicted GH43/DUF377 family glycosyl hydrolase
VSPLDPAGDLVVRRSTPVLRPDPTRVLLRPFLPGQELVARGVSRAEAVVSRVLVLDDETVRGALDETVDRFGARHDDVLGAFRAHAALLPPHLEGLDRLTGPQTDLVGAFVSQEYALEAAAILNPSLVAHPDQSGLAAGELRVVMAVRSVGEGHISSLELRTGVVAEDGSVVLDAPGDQLMRGIVSRAPISLGHLTTALRDADVWSEAEPLVRRLPDPFTPEQLESLLHRFELTSSPHLLNGTPLNRIRAIAESFYRVEFPAGSAMSERVLFPVSADERGGIEDVRFVRFTDDDGMVSYRGTYTAYNGSAIAQHLIETTDFLTFDVRKLVGDAAHDKGLALFPRPIGNRYWSLARWDRENLGLARSVDGVGWTQAATIQHPREPWQLIQLGTCAPPVETEHGWLVITHGVGPVRRYSIGAMLLDLDDPTRVIGSLSQPLMSPTPDEAVGYVPNVLYTCGVVVHAGQVILPYGCSDSSIRFATVDLDRLLQRLTAADD